eukprot:CAMPEP_0184478814 /NCGR_PEP_ID=MMETSP0113_2-20130426/734_1 /TAXON_ID=91329 /ORGANISM="Norrisiella sphaerica, Strain BC52" /LENGTH=406 /DNA_ID=CAMNT_0026856721 /DNA_START=155 /DNA_END=1375 /DNA_ORIENTATION=+
MLLAIGMGPVAEGAWTKADDNMTAVFHQMSEGQLDNGMYTVPLMKRTSFERLRKHRFNALRMRRDEIRILFEANATSFVRMGRKAPIPAESYKLHLTDKQSEFTAPINIGGQEMQCIYDTGSAIVWVYSDLCHTKDCKRHSFRGSVFMTDEADGDFSPSKCGRFVQFGTGSLSGVLATDTISLAGLNLAGAGFGLIKHTDSNPVFQLDFDGICGISYKMEEQACLNEKGQEVQTSLLDNLLHSNLAHKTLTFSFDNDGGELIFGAPPPPDSIAIPVSRKFYWEAELADIEVNGESLFKLLGWDSNTKTSLVFDTGTSILTMPFDAFTQVHKMSSCEGRKAITYVMKDGHRLHVENWYETYGASCTPSIMDLDIQNQNLFILGQPFFSEYITTFDAGKEVIWVSKRA